MAEIWQNRRTKCFEFSQYALQTSINEPRMPWYLQMIPWFHLLPLMCMFRYKVAAGYLRSVPLQVHGERCKSSPDISIRCHATLHRASRDQAAKCFCCYQEQADARWHAHSFLCRVARTGGGGMSPCKPQLPFFPIHLKPAPHFLMVMKHGPYRILLDASDCVVVTCDHHPLHENRSLAHRCQLQCTCM